MDLLQPLVFHVRIDLGRGDVDVAQHHLHGAQIGTVFQQMRGERMTQHVRGDRLVNAGPERPPPENGPKALPRHGRPPPRHEQRRR